MTLPFEALACPLDGSALQRADNCWRCESGHSFDIAAQGYVNLLPVQHKRSRDPGDSKEMILARQRFLEAGHYLPIAQAVSRAVLGMARAQAAPVPNVGEDKGKAVRSTNGAALAGDFSCLDAGCGEGYYLRELIATANLQHDGTGLVPTSDAPGTLIAIGVDISKWAVMAAAKRDKRATWLVGTNAKLPIQSKSVDLVLCMFGFPVYPEFARVLQPAGSVLQVDAGPDHLRELREIIYPSLRAERPSEPQTPDGFRQHPSQRVRYSLTLSGKEAIGDLLVMTPHFYRANSEGRSKAAALDELTLTVDVVLTPFTLVSD